MRQIFVFFVSIAMIGVAASGAQAQQEQQEQQGQQGQMSEHPLVQQVMTGCENEINTYCSQVQPGQGRMLACLYAHNDRLSNECEYALYDASIQLERAVAAINYVAQTCRSDIQSYCAGVEAGEGRILDCLEQHSGEISAGCSQALDEVGLTQQTN